MKKHIPNTLTCCNLISGCVAVAFAHDGRLGVALLFIVAGALFDFLDGFAARLLNVSCAIGKELDSLADVVTFGVAPATMLCFELSVIDYPAAIEPARSWLPYVAFVMSAFAALRLAKFNLDTRQTTSFIGLPTPANALFWASLLVGGRSIIEGSSVVTMWLPAGTILLLLLVLAAAACWIMTAEVPMFALKFKHFGWHGNEVRYIFLIVCIPLIIILGIASFAAIIVWYVVLSGISSHRKIIAADEGECVDFEEVQ